MKNGTEFSRNAYPVRAQASICSPPTTPSRNLEMPKMAFPCSATFFHLTNFPPPRLRACDCSCGMAYSILFPDGTGTGWAPPGRPVEDNDDYDDYDGYMSFSFSYTY